jgi:PHD/YefM family antitoxin component YafN of YafNO toxin-antitoxin module
MKTIEVNEATAPLAEYAQHVDEEPLILTIAGKPVAVLLSAESIDLESLSLSANPEFVRIIEESRARHRREGGISSEDMRRQLGLTG